MKKSIVAVLLTALATPAFAESSMLDGFYVGATLGQGSANFSAPVGSGLIVDNTKSRAVYGVFGGYRFSPNLAAEIDYTGASYIYTTTPAGVRYLSKQIVIAAVAVGTYPISDTFSVYGKLGLSRASSESPTVGEQTTSRTGLTAGIGAEYKFTPHIAGRLGIDSYAVGATIPTAVPAVAQSSRATVVNAGVSYSF